MADPAMFKDLRNLEQDERRRLESRLLVLQQLGDRESGRRPRTREEEIEFLEVGRRLTSRALVDPLFRAVRDGLARDLGDHWEGLQSSQLLRAAKERGGALLALSGLGVLQPADGKAGAAEAALEAEFFGSQELDPEHAGEDRELSTEDLQEVAELLAGAARRPPKSASELAQLRKQVQGKTRNTAFGAAVEEALARALFEEVNVFAQLVQRLRQSRLASANGSRENLEKQRKHFERMLGAVCGLLQLDRRTPADLPLPGLPEDPRSSARRQSFGIALFAAQGEYLTNEDLFRKVLPILIRAGEQGPFSVVSGTEWAGVVRYLLKRGVTADEPQLARRVDEALNTVQNVGDQLPPSLINIDLPDLEEEATDHEIVKENIQALQPAYFAAMFEEMKAFQVVDKLVELFQAGILPVGRGEAGDLLFRYWKDAALRVSESERRSFYGRTLGIPGGDDGGNPNREFNELWLRFVSAVSSFVRQNNVDDLLRSRIPGSISQQQVRKAARDLGANLSLHGYGIAYFMATELQKQVKEVMKILSEPDVKAAYGARDMWQVIDQVSALELGGGKNTVRYRTMAASGAIIMAWLAKKSRQLSTSSFDRILDVDDIRTGAPRRNGKPTVDPSDFDLVNACEQWLAVTGTQEDLVENYAQPREAPSMPSRPIQIPAIAREMLESVGAPALGLGLRNGASRYAGN